jgi:branched-chain amino acid transport system permease protein
MLSVFGSYQYLAATTLIYIALGYSIYFVLRAGLFATPQVGFFGVGAYTSTLLLVDQKFPFFLAVLLGGVAAAVVGALLALLLRRVKGIYLAIATIAFIMVVQTVAGNLSITGGPSGIYEIPLDTEGWQLVGLVVILFIIAWAVGRSRAGVAMDAMRQDTLVAEHIGIKVGRSRVYLLTASGLIAGVAGGLFVSFQGFVVPGDFDIDLLLSTLSLVVVGGLYQSIGPIVGGIVIYGLPQAWTNLGNYQDIFLGVVLALVIIFAPTGLSGLIADQAHRVWRWAINRRIGEIAPGAATPAGDEKILPSGSGDADPESNLVAAAGSDGGSTRDLAKMTAPPELRLQAGQRASSVGDSGRGALSVAGVTVKFGGLTAVSDVSFTVAAGDHIGVLGPNGSGKSTLLNVISGAVLPNAGTVSVDGVPLGLGRPSSIAACGVARTFQGIRLFQDFSVLENVAIGRYLGRTEGTQDGVGGGRRNTSRSRLDAARHYLEMVGVPKPMWESPVKGMPYGYQRRVEIARALISDPKLLLLDEPTAGMGAVETLEIFELVSSVSSKTGTTMVTVEHDVPTVRSFCSRLLVLNYGELIADGKPDSVLENDDVVEAYLGRNSRS